MRLPPELAGRWNHNTHYYPLALAATPCRRALDVGCGDGLLLRLMAPYCEQVVGVDPWTPPIDGVPNSTVLRQGFLDAELEPRSFDLVCSFAAIHHLPFEPALARMADLVRPGGRLVVLGLAKYSRASWLLGASGILPHQVMSRVRGYWQHPAPIAEPTMTWSQIRAAQRRVVPGARMRYRLYWRYSIEWTRPN